MIDNVNKYLVAIRYRNWCTYYIIHTAKLGALGRQVTKHSNNDNYCRHALEVK